MVETGGGGPEACDLELIDTPSLPINHTMSDGTSITIRCMRHDDVQLFFNALKSAAEAGLGYGYDELPNLDFFVNLYVRGHRNFVVESTQTGDVISYFNLGPPSLFARTADPVIRDGGNVILTPKYRRRNWYAELGNFMLSVLSERKFLLRGLQSDSAVTNLAVQLGITKTNYMVNGILPRAIYFKEQGWVDLVLSFRPCHHSDEMLAKL